MALVGSHATGLHAPDSDYDVFIYTEGDLADLRAKMIDELGDASSWRSVHEHAFGDEDAWRLSAHVTGWISCLADHLGRAATGRRSATPPRSDWLLDCVLAVDPHE